MRSRFMLRYRHRRLMQHCKTGWVEIPIEERSGDEVARISGVDESGNVHTVSLLPTGSATANPAFDVTPARLITGLLTERGLVAPNQDALQAAFPERFTQQC